MVGDVAVDDYGVGGPGPDGLVMPEGLAGGTWRLCTANAVDHVCVQLFVGLDGAVPLEDEQGDDLDSDPEAQEAPDTSSELAMGELCEPGPDPSVSADDAVEGQRGEALVKFLTGIDELVLQEEEEGIDIVYDDPNYGGVWGDSAGGWVVAVLDCSIVDADRIAEIAGGADAVRLIHVAHTFEEVNDFRDRLVSELRASGVAADVPIDSTLTGRQIRVIVNDAEQLDENFASDIPETAFTIEVGETSQAD